MRAVFLYREQKQQTIENEISIDLIDAFDGIRVGNKYW
jgi:hypothetical protein